MPGPMGASTNRRTKEVVDEVQIIEVKKERLTVHILGDSPLIFNAMADKARRTLLLPPPGRMNAAAKATNVKHDPAAEFFASTYRMARDSDPTLLAMPPTAFKGAARTAALDIPGAAKSQIGRLLYVEGAMTPVYGEPQLLMSVVRSADIKRTPDVRTRCIVPQWACTLTVSYAVPLLKREAVIRLIAASGITSGVGDWRTEKGSGNYGSFRIVPADDEEYLAITSVWGRQAQLAAMAEPVMYDVETSDLMSWFRDEATKRELKVTTFDEAVA